MNLLDTNVVSELVRPNDVGPPGGMRLGEETEIGENHQDQRGAPCHALHHFGSQRKTFCGPISAADLPGAKPRRKVRGRGDRKVPPPIGVGVFLPPLPVFRHRLDLVAPTGAPKGRRQDKPPETLLRTLRVLLGRGRSRRETVACAPGKGGQESPPSNRSGGFSCPHSRFSGELAGSGGLDFSVQ